MNRLVSLLLVPFFVLGQALPHSHAGTGVLQPDGHSTRAHFHLVVGHHQDHDYEHDHHHTGDQAEAGHSESAALSVPGDHDSDAIYLADTDWTVSRTVSAPQVDSTAVVWTSFVPSVGREVRLCCRMEHPPDRDAGLPIYLLTGSLRL